MNHENMPEITREKTEEIYDKYNIPEHNDDILWAMCMVIAYEEQLLKELKNKQCWCALPMVTSHSKTCKKVQEFLKE